ncbi:MAG: 50S ribosomal protein L5 [Peptoniphilaceae bacterium]|nr:50S ribosomal protein L5 [Peptoniphilaceae bacterium]MCI6659952.1 50S ribosomal protein L5 [Peptoniphilaceae bacterium]
MKDFHYDNVMQVPKLEKIVINIAIGEAKDNPKLLESAVRELTQISGQKPVVIKAKRSVANFKLREGQAIATKVTLRRKKMYDFLDKLINVALPRVRDFRGISDTSFDGRGNYALGIKEQLIFPEINYDDVDEIHGMDIIIVTSAKTDEEAKAFLTYLGMPFAKR